MGQPEYNKEIKIDIDKIKIISNTRIKQTDINELAKSIKTVGVINPITVYKAGDFYNLIAGERRLMAAKKNKEKTILCRILKNPTNENIFNIQLIENIQREELHPLDEAEAFCKIKSIQELINKTGKSKQYIYDRLTLLLLSDKAKELFYNNTITISHALQLAKVNKSQQDVLLTKITTEIELDGTRKIICNQTAQWLKSTINIKLTANLNEAIFSPSDTTLGKIDCINCPSRSGYNKSLFNDIIDNNVCFNISCYKDKQYAQCERIEKQLKDNGFETKKITGLYEPNKNSNLEWEMFFDISEKYKVGDIVGIYFDHIRPDKIGAVVGIKQKATDNSEPLDIKRAKAVNSFLTAILNSIGIRIGEYNKQSIPKEFLQIIIENIFFQLTDKKQTEIAKFYKLQNIITKKQELREIIEQLSDIELVRLVMICVILLEFHENKHDMYYVSKLAHKFNIDILRLKTEIENQYNVTLNIIKTLFDE